MDNKTDVVCIGQALVDCITKNIEETPHRENVYRAQAITLGTGGDAVNEAIVLRRLGRRTALVCGLGEDIAGRMILDEMRNSGVDISRVTVSPELTTPVADLLVRQDGSRSSINSRATLLEGYTPPLEAVQNAKIVSLASLFRAPLDRPEVIMALIRAAKEAGAIVCADTKLPTYREIHLRDLTDVLPLIDYIFPNNAEAAFYTGETDLFAMAEQIHAMGVKHVIVKAGKQGCVAVADKYHFAMPCKKVEVVDSSGAGDNFVAGFLNALLNGEKLYHCCAEATMQAAVCVSRIGTH